MEIKVRCSKCLSELDAEIIDNDIFVDICETCFSEMYEEGRKDERSEEQNIERR
jgi:hypothetical protein